MSNHERVVDMILGRRKSQIFCASIKLGAFYVVDPRTFFSHNLFKTSSILWYKKLKFPSSRSNIASIIVIVAIAAILSIVSYQYSNYDANEILKISSDDVRANADI